MTSGSSGKPFTIYRSPREEHLLNLFRLRACAEAGLRTFDRIARFSQLPLDEMRRGWPGRIRQAIGIHCEQRLDGLAPADEMIDHLLRHRPDVVCGYPSMLRQSPTRMRSPSRAAMTAATASSAAARSSSAAARRTIEDSVLRAAGRFLRRARIQSARLAMPGAAMAITCATTMSWWKSSTTAGVRCR